MANTSDTIPADSAAPTRENQPAKANRHQLRSARTREAILDASERLFAPHGITGASMRQIAKEADVDLALVTYHFTTKEALYQTVVDRIIVDFAARRMGAFEDLNGRTSQPSVLELFEVQIQAWLYIRFDAPEPRARMIMNRFHRPDTDRGSAPPDGGFVRQFLTALEEVLPDRTQADIHWAYHAVMGSIIYYVNSRDRITRVSGEWCDSDSRETLAAQMRSVVRRLFEV